MLLLLVALLPPPRPPALLNFCCYSCTCFRQAYAVVDDDAGAHN
jgi:hypothetical protein